MHRRHILMAGLLAVLAIFIGCPQKKDTGGNGSSGGGDTIKIGVAGPITGPAAAFGEMIQKATQLKIDEINAAGGIKGKQVEALIEDDRGDTTEAANVSRKLASDKSVCLVIGHFNSTCSNAAKEEYNRKGVLQFSPGSTNVKVCVGSPWTFRNLYRDDFQGQLLARYSKDVLGAKKIAVFYDNDDYGKGLMESCKKEAEKIGLEMLEPISYVRERTSDFKPLVGKIKDKGAEAIILCGLYGDAATIVKAARNDLDINVPVLGGDGVLNDQFIKNAGKAAEGCLVFTPFLYDLVKDDPKAKAFYDSFRKKYNKDPDTWAALTYDAVGMALAAVEEVGTDREKVRDWMAACTSAEKCYDGVTGKTWFDEEGDCYSKGLHVAVVKDGKFAAAEKQVKLD
jgi:branched-chain amino acid transport system substrate-binding protein